MVVDAIEDHYATLRKPLDANLAPKKEIELFKHTANSYLAIGPEGRHGSVLNQPPTNPMSLADARSLVDRLLNAWIKTL